MAEDNVKMELAKKDEISAAAKFADIGEFDREKYQRFIGRHVAEAKLMMVALAERFFKAGAMLILAKNELKYGEWADFLKEIDLKQRTANRYMLAFRRAADYGVLNKGLMELGFSKAEDILSLPEGEVRAMLETDEQKDKYGRMTAAELKAEVRKLMRQSIKQDEKIKNGSAQLQNQADTISRLRGENVQAIIGSTTSKLMKATKILSACTKDELPTGDDERSNVKVMADAVLKNAVIIYNRFQFQKAGDVKHRLPDEYVKQLDDQQIEDVLEALRERGALKS